jgi:hypothetical protein
MWLMKGFSSGSDFLFAPFFDLKISLSCDLEAILGCGVSKYMYWEIYLDGRLGLRFGGTLQKTLIFWVTVGSLLFSRD